MNVHSPVLQVEYSIMCEWTVFKDLIDDQRILNKSLQNNSYFTQWMNVKGSKQSNNLNYLTEKPYYLRSEECMHVILVGSGFSYVL